MSKITKKIILCFVSFLICFLSYKLCYFIAEKYFFDKFFYRKSVTHGYWFKNKSIADYGDRAKDLVALESKNPNILGTKDDKNFKITIIGDSFVWGQGIKNNERMVKKLEDKLNKIRPTTIISLAEPGWNSLDYLRITSQFLDSYSPDIIIFILVSNESLIYESDINLPIVQECLALNIGSSITFEQDLGGNKTKLINNKIQTYEDILTQAWASPINSCILDKTLQFLPTTNAIYFITDDYYGNISFFQTFNYYLNKNNKYVLSGKSGKYINKYTKYFDNAYKNFVVSPSEGHPNALANQMYADILYNEITTNPKWGF